MDWQKQELKKRKESPRVIPNSKDTRDEIQQKIFDFWDKLIQENEKLHQKLQLYYIDAGDGMLISPYNKKLILISDLAQIMEDSDSTKTYFYIFVNAGLKLTAKVVLPVETFSCVIDENSPAQIIKNLVTGQNYWKGLKQR